MSVVEQWKPVYGYEGIYEVSDLGRVRSVDRIDFGGRKLKGAYLSHNVHGESNRHTVMLYRDGKRRRVQVHVLVLEAFVSPRPDGMLGLHWDDDRHNNRLSNLRWGSKSENGVDAVRNKRLFATRKTHCKRGHKLELPNLLMTQWEKGYRTCLACSRATSVMTPIGDYDASEIQDLADSKYRDIMSSHGSKV